MDVGSINNNSLDIQSLLINNSNGINRANSNDITNRTADYAKKGEPMYMADMDADEDGTVTLDEYRDYCKSKGINTKEMIKMSQMAASYRTMKAENETIDYISKLIPNVSPKVKQADSTHVKQSENKYNISADTNSKVSYKEYMEYCQQNARSQNVKSNAMIEKTEDGTFNISNSGKVMNLYRNNSNHSIRSTFEDVI